MIIKTQSHHVPILCAKHHHPSPHSTLTCISGPELAIEAIVSDPIEVTMSLNLRVSMAAISLVLSISSSFCSRMNLFSASLALVSRSSSDSWGKGQEGYPHRLQG